MPNSVDDRLVLVDNELPQDRSQAPNDGWAADDHDVAVAAGGFAADAVANQFMPATLPQPVTTSPDRYGGSGGADMQSVDLRHTHDIDDGPPDKFGYTYFVLYLLGTATMTPWNFFITAEDYWMYKFRNVTADNTTEPAADLTPLQRSFTCDLTLTASISGTTFLILHAIYGQRFSLKFKMLTTLCTIFLIFLVTTAFVEVNTDQWQKQFFLITLFTVVIINISSATMSGAVFGIAGLFPAEYMSALVSGQALGGIFTALTFILVLAFGASPSATAFVYFSIGSFLIVLSILNYVIMSRRPFFKHYVDGGEKQLLPAGESEAGMEKLAPPEAKLSEVFGKIYAEVVGVCLLFATTLSVYPAVSVLMQSENYGQGYAWNDIYYLPVVNYLFFNSGDYFGRILAGVWQVPRDNPHTVLLMIILRMLYIPFFLCSNTALHNFLPIIVRTDAAFIIMMITFALTNGYLANIVLIMAPRSVEHHEKEMASSIMAAALSCGLALGSMLSMIFVQLL